MPQGTENEQERRAAPLRNPAAGAVLAVRAGEQLAAEFEFVNDSPDVAVFDLQIEGLPGHDWLNVDQGRYSATAAASGVGSVLLVLDPPASAAVGEYPFFVTIVSGGAPIGQGKIPLVLRVDAAAARPAQRAPRKVETPIPEPDGEAETVAPLLPPLQETIEQPPPKPKRQAAPKQVVEEAPPPAEAEEPKVVLRPGTRRVEPEPEPEIEAEPEPEPEIRPTAQSATPPQAMPTSRPTPTPQPVPLPQDEAEENLPVVDYSTHASSQAEDDQDYEEPAITERSVLDPIEGSIFTLFPGDTILVRFSFINDSPNERTYILDEDRSLETGWISLVQDQVNLTRNGRGEVSLRLSPPRNAEPGDYPFTVTTGLQGGALSSLPLTLSVQAMPAVKLSAKQPLVSMGPLTTTADFQILVDSAGNADTAFRIGVKNPESTAESAGAQKPDIIYETKEWRYLFDREMEDLRSPSYGRAPQAVPIRLRLHRRGPWWFGFRESHTVRVAAVPVTEPGNNNKPGNTVELTARRWRFLPVPLGVLLPIAVLAMLFFSQGARTVEVENAYHDPQGQYWVVNPPGDQKKFVLDWDAPSFIPLHLSATNAGQVLLSQNIIGSGSYAATMPVSSQDRRVNLVYRINRMFGGGERDATVALIYTRTDTPLVFTDANAHQDLTGSTITLAVPTTGYARLDLKNASVQFNRVDWWMADTLDTNGPFSFLYNKDSGSIEPGGTEHFLIKRNPGAAPDATDDIVFVTTDATRPVVTVNLVSR